MHTKIFKLPLLFVAFLFHGATYAQDAKRTEEYAVISAWQSGKVTRISVTFGSTPTPEKEFEKNKTDKFFDLTPVIREMEALNAMGFELVTGNSTNMNSGDGASTPFYTFVFMRRLP